MELSNLTKTEYDTLSDKLTRLRKTNYTNNKSIVRTILAVGLLYLASIGYNCYQIMQTKAWHVRVGLTTSSYEVISDLKEDQIFNGVVGTYIGAKRLVSEDFDRKVRHLEFYQVQVNETQKEFATEINQLLIPHF